MFCVMNFAKSFVYICIIRVYMNSFIPLYFADHYEHTHNIWHIGHSVHYSVWNAICEGVGYTHSFAVYSYPCYYYIIPYGHSAGISTKLVLMSCCSRTTCRLWAKRDSSIKKLFGVLAGLKDVGSWEPKHNHFCKDSV